MQVTRSEILSGMSVPPVWGGAEAAWGDLLGKPPEPLQHSLCAIYHHSRLATHLGSYELGNCTMGRTLVVLNCKGQNGGSLL